MKILIIFYDLQQPDQNYEKVTQKIRSYENWAMLGRSAYLIMTNSTVVQVRDAINSLLNKGDKLFVGTCPVPAAWIGLPDDVSRWIQENQPKHK